MIDIDFFFWLLFMLAFAVLPIKQIVKYFFTVLGWKDTKLYVEEENYHEKHYSQLYRPGDKKYNSIVKLSNNAKSINEI
jgi:hypothetical protein